MEDSSRRNFLKWGTTGLGGIALANPSAARDRLQRPVPKAKRVVFLFQAGGPSQLEMFDPKPSLANYRGKELPASVTGSVRLAQQAGAGKLTVANALVGFAQHGESGLWVSEPFPHIASIADDLCVIKSMKSDAVNHDPATNLFLTGNQLAGMPSVGAWVGLGVGSANSALPSFVTMASKSQVQFTQPLGKRLWSSAFLPATHQGVSLRPGTRPVLFLDDGSNLAESAKRQLHDAVLALNQSRHAQTGDPRILQRNQAYHIAASMQTSMVELADTSNETDEVFELYGPQARTPGSYAANCLRARRLLERDVRFVQVMHRGWDHHYTQTEHIKILAEDTDQPTAALIKDLKRRGLLDDTLVVWGGEFGRTPYSQGKVTPEDHGRDHHPYCFNVFLAGAGIKPGISYGETDDFSFHVAEKAVHVHDLHATILHLMGLDHRTFAYRHQGRDHRLTDISGRVVTDLLS